MTRKRALLIAGTLLLICGAVLLSLATRATPYVSDRGVAALNGRFESEAELQSLQVSVFPRPQIDGERLVLRHRGRRDVPPLISIDAFSAGAGLYGLVSEPMRFHTVHLDGLAIRLPPGGLDADDITDVNGSTGRDASAITIDRIISHTARLEIASKQRGKLPRVFEIHDLVMTEFGVDRPASFQASLTNPKPEGRIDTTGSFGPWDKKEPRLTHLQGEYIFRQADLDTIKGIGGILSSNGRFAGVLGRVEVQGETDTPDFVVDIAGHPVHLKTRFAAIVDGTNGDTRLDLVHASFLQSTIVARGAVIRTVDVKGRRVSLDVTIDKGRIEDLLKLAVTSDRPLLTGQVDVTTKMLLPAGEQDVVQRLQLDGQFHLAQAQFTSFDVQKQINVLSRRGRGDTDDRDGKSVVSDLHGGFVLKDGVLRFSSLTFAVPGAIVQLAGSYALEAETLEFAGHLLLDASLSEATTGFKSLVAKVVQPLFRRPGGGSKLPIKVSGTRSKLSFGLDVKKALTPGK